MQIRIAVTAMLLALLSSSFSAPEAWSDTEMKSKDGSGDSAPQLPKQIEPGVFEVPIVVSKSLEARREEFKKDFIDAQKRLRTFAEKYGWADLMKEPFVKQVEIYGSKPEWDKRLREFYPKDAPAVIPKTFVAGVENDNFFSVSPEVYYDCFPEGKDEPDAFVKLMTHELAHRLHVRICKGDEGKMGPIWFWEGFAVYAADQLNINKPDLSNAEIWDIVNAKERGSYRKYNVVFRHFLGGMPLPEYVQKAGEKDFDEWLKKQK